MSTLGTKRISSRQREDQEIEEMKKLLDQRLLQFSRSQRYKKAIFKILGVNSDYSEVASNPGHFFEESELEEEEVGDFIKGCKIIRLKMTTSSRKVREILGGEQEPLNQKEGLSKEEEKENEKHKLFLLTYKEELEKIGLIEINGIWYFDECTGWKKWPKIGEKYLSSFPSSKWNKKRGIGTPTGVIQNKDYLKEMFRGLGFDVATEAQELERYRNILLSHKKELEKIGLIEIDSVWYFSECIQSKDWPRVGGKYLTNFPSATLNKGWGIGNSAGTIQDGKELKKMFTELGLSIATETQELERYKNVLLSHRGELKKIGLREIRGIWYFYKCRGNQDWPKIGKIGKRYIGSFLPTDLMRNGLIGRDKGDITNKRQLKKLFKVLGISIATSEQESKEKRREKDRQAKKFAHIQGKATPKKGTKEFIQVMQDGIEFDKEVIDENFRDEFNRFIKERIISLNNGDYTLGLEYEYLMRLPEISKSVFLEFVENLPENDKAEVKKLYPTNEKILQRIDCLVQDRIRILNGSKQG